jgi:hypothetical protein
MWGGSGHGDTSAPSNGIYTKVYSNAFAFAALKADGSITAWGDSNKGGSNAPAGSSYTKIYSASSAFAAHAVIDPSALRAAKANAFE